LTAVFIFDRLNNYITKEVPYGYFGCPKSVDIIDEAPYGYFGCPKSVAIIDEREDERNG